MPGPVRTRRLFLRLVSAAFAVLALPACLATAQTPWVSSGNGPRNQHANNSPPSAQQLSFGNVKRLAVKWFYPTTAGVSATPTVEPGGVYVVTQDGLILKLDPDTGALIWSHSLPAYLPGDQTGLTGFTPASPAIGGDRIVVGINDYMIAINKATGALIWATQLDSRPRAEAHTSPIIIGNQVFTGLMSHEEYYAPTESGYVPIMRGSAMALNLTTGAIQWKTYMVPDGYTGGDIWGNSGAGDAGRGLVYFTTGNNFTVPPDVGACIRAAGASDPAQRACLDPSDYVDSFVALRISDGSVAWTRPTIGGDAWLPLAYCALPTNTTCPTLASSKHYDMDFAQGPSLFYVNSFTGVPDDRGGTSKSWILGAGQKNGIFWALNPDNGGLFWSTKLFQQCCTLQWGHAADTANGMVYVPFQNNSTTATNTLVGRNGVAIPNVFGGAWAGLDSKTGTIKFQIQPPGQALDNPAYPGNTPGGLSVANGIVFGGTTSGYFTAFDKTGWIHWKYFANAVIAGAPAIYNERVYWGAGNYKPVVANQTYGVYCFAVQ